MKPLISVIIPVYKVEEYLDRCVTSVVNQTYKNLEIILVDDGSPDRCPEMCDRWAEKDPRIKVIHKENGGLSDARNAGIKILQGELVAFLDSDDWVHVDFYKTLYEALTHYDCDIAECEYVKTTGDVPETRASQKEPLICDAETAMRLHIQDSCFKQVVWNKIYKRETITAMFEKGRCHEDVFWTHQIIGNARKLVHVYSEMLYYFQRSDSIMGEHYTEKRLDGVYAKCQRYCFLSESFPNLLPMGSVDLVMTCLYNGQKALSFLSKEKIKNVFFILSDIVKAYPIVKGSNYKMSIKEKLWLKCAKLSLKSTCRIRNLLKIGI